MWGSGGGGRQKILNVLFPAREDPENCQARSGCSTVIGIIGWMNKGTQLIRSQPVWERSSVARVQLPDSLFPTCYWLSGKRGCVPQGVLHTEDPIMNSVSFPRSRAW